MTGCQIWKFYDHGQNHGCIKILVTLAQFSRSLRDLMCLIRNCMCLWYVESFSGMDFKLGHNYGNHGQNPRHINFWCPWLNFQVCCRT